MGERNWTNELEHYLVDCFARFCAASGQPVPFSGLRINPPLGIEESRYFLLGLGEGLFRINQTGQIESDLISSGNHPNPTRLIPIFRSHPFPPRFFRDSVCRLSTASSLILKRGWLKSHVEIESTEESGAKILVKSPAGSLLIGIEVKRNGPEVHKLITDLRNCCNRGTHARDDCGFPQNHPVYEFCTLRRPVYFCGVAPDSEISLRMKYDGTTIQLEQLPSLPPRSVIEMA